MTLTILGCAWLLTLLVVCFHVHFTTAESSNTTNSLDDGLDLLESISPSAAGMKKISVHLLQFTDQFPGIQVHSTDTAKFLERFYGELSLQLKGTILSVGHVPILAIHLKHWKLPLLEISLNTKSRCLILRYHGRTSFQRVTLDAVLPEYQWNSLIVRVNRTSVSVRVDCDSRREMALRQPVAIPSAQDEASIWLGKRVDKYSGFEGILFEARLHSAYTKDTECDHQPQSDAPQLDEGKRSRVTSGERLRQMEQRVSQLALMVDMLKTQNNELTARVGELEKCECISRCSHNGITYGEGESWNPDFCTVCRCVGGVPACSMRADVPSCQTPCLTSPCSPQGSCVDSESTVGSFLCLCQPPYGGPTCQDRLNPCIWPVDPGSCNQSVPRFYYDRNQQVCQEFNYSGCGGNVNNYESEGQCVDTAMQGACCYRTYSTALESIVQVDQQLEVRCQVLHVGECKTLHHKPDGDRETEVISFYPGLNCEEIDCVTASKCIVGNVEYNVGETFQLGCENCTCQNGGKLSCSCKNPSVRKELRDLTREEIVHFQNAVRLLRQSGNFSEWEAFRDIYMTHNMHVHGGAFYLPWHREFLRQVELKLQKIDCSIVLPYFDFTTDVGNFSSAIIWQPNYFGGDGEGNCVPDFPFGGSSAWKPCVIRQFNTSIRLPTQIELALALASDDYMEMSLCLETFAAYLHVFIGGDMATPGSPYDPVFFAIHSYIDMLYSVWQSKGSNAFKFPAAYGNIPMVPFNIPPHAVFDLEAMCVTYKLPSRGHPCNTSVTVPRRVRPSVKRGDIDPVSTYTDDDFDQFGYDEDGFDRNGFDRFGFNRKGYNRDGFDEFGYDYDGYNRYGFDSAGYNRHGFNVEGFDRTGNPDTSGQYGEKGFDIMCLDRRGLDPNGFDRFGFTIGGYDAGYCNYRFNGPFSTGQSLVMFETLSSQGKGFLMMLPRICEPLAPLPDTWLEQHWITNIKDVSGMIPVNTSHTGVSIPSSRFCFDTKPFLSACPCPVPAASCHDNPCVENGCPGYPDAICRVTFCGGCKAVWFINNLPVNCLQERDHCSPNPCHHGGTCMTSVWPSEPDKVTCICPPGYDGHLCQYEAYDVCSLPLITGNCDKQETRWYFNYRKQKCEQFVYTGCSGNSNNFKSANSCQARCMIGACCYREPLFPRRIIGYDSQGYDRYGFNVEGFDRFGNQRTVNNGIFTAREKYDDQGFDWQGYNLQGYDEDGYDRQGYDRHGFDREGFNVTGYSRIGEYDGIIDYDGKGYDPEGYNRAGYNCYGYNREGFDVFGVSAGFVYHCRSMILNKCQSLEVQGQVEVVQFTRGKRCGEINCGETCGCMYNNRTYEIGEQFQSGCQTCTCSENGAVYCLCSNPVKRKEIREMTKMELWNYQIAIRKLQTAHPSKWWYFAQTYANHKPQAVGTDAFLPWHRYFLWNVEQALQEIDCSVAIPYYDWTIDVGKPEKSVIWAANMFGGNGENLTECVTYHPFKKYFPPYLTPCLRRHFDLRVKLPDLVSVQLALRETEYKRFRIKMEIFTKLFQAWVGGHMSSDLSPYDPLFYSYMGYIDKLWHDWQLRHHDGLLRYPQRKRYLPMLPFKITPDNVMDLRIQMCIEYLPLTKGAPCNVTEIRNYGYDDFGFDRHGYNREGYDKDGFTVLGFDLDGNPDFRGIYNARGYDRMGYGRDGYDMSGFDKYGFYIDGYNVDGFDPFGYDRIGYDRFGFNKLAVTPFGLLKNGTYLGREEVDISLFDEFGYNKYGFNKFGFDREGYDVFGFDSMGYDKYICNYYHLGPMNLLVKHYVSGKLIDLDKETLTKIKRICPPVTKLEDWQIVTNWLHRDDQVELIETIQKVRRKEHGIDTEYRPRKSSVTEDLIWVPIAPDESLCVVTHAYDVCPIDKPAVLCTEDLCQGRNCPDHPNAVCRTSSCGSCHHEWYEGTLGTLLNCSGCYDDRVQFRQEGERWRNDKCETCVCQTGMVDCRPLQCEPVYCQHPIRAPGECCVNCERGCMYQGKLYPTGTTFDDARDPCTHCICDRGNVTCRAETCPSLASCHSPAASPASCCPVCMDCGNRVNGSQWNPTPCQKCVCVNGAVHCDKVTCPRPECEHPYTPEGKCCPVCVACFYQGTIYQDGEDFRPDMCTSCHCVHGNVNCVTIDCPAVTCTSPIVPAGKCCPVCDSDCEYDMRRYAHNSFFSPSYNPCLNCSCVNSLVRCHSVHCPQQHLPCERPVRRLGECCPSHCPKCTHQGAEHDDGETWTPRGSSCEVCECRDGLVTCRTRKTCALECTHGVVRKGQCCSPCTDCLYDSRVIGDGRSFIRAGSPCQQCRCVGGNIECHIVGRCPRLPCAVTEMTPDHCCPQCKGCDYKGRRYQHGEMVSQDKCSRCVCKEGQISCDQVPCPKLHCSNPVPVEGECCPQCANCDYYGRVYDDGQQFVSQRDPCHICVCRKGQVSCQSREQNCPPVTCTHPDQIRGQCCRQCDNCRYERRRLRNGQQFTPGTDPCYTCTCKDGSVKCGRRECSEVNCLNPVTPPGQCCPVCSSACLMDGQEYQDGERFPNMQDDCSICTCNDGDISCQPRPCPRLLCSHPARLPGDCCPNCDFCLHERRIFRNMQRFIHPTDVCQQCVCNSGSIVCSAVKCPPLPCSQPMPMPGSCCPVCPKQCTYGGLSYEDGQTFKSPRDKCEECLCLQGRVQCKKMKCPLSTCTHPVEQNCCQICEDCSFKNQVWRNGLKFQDPQDSCSRCRCQNGNVWCERATCPPVTCRDPSTSDCCAVCSDCQYEGRHYANRQRFSIGCRMCTCLDGTVDCRSGVCAAPACKHPVDGECCKECTDCLYLNRQYSNHQRFTNPRNKCEECVCVDGTVTCDRKSCPRVACQNPTQGDCCPVCSDCQYQGRTVRNGLRIPHESDPCKECICRRGNLECFQRQCLNTICRHPVKRRCCLECSACLYDDREYANREKFPDPTDKCRVCQCIDGNVACTAKTCPQVRCTNPVQGPCCLECSKCLHKNSVYVNGQDFPHESDPCQTCTCQDGSVVCSKQRCPNVVCSHPVQGQCCPECGGDCHFERRLYKNGEKFQKDCKVCTCVEGDMRCYPKYCPKVQCSNPAIEDCCPVCGDCMFEDRHFRNGQTFPDVKDPCSECFCRNGTFQCRKKPCPEAVCQNPAPGLCCPKCRNCALHDKVLPHGYRFPGESDPCQTCVCEAGTISCERRICDPPTCDNPVVDSCGCSACRQCHFEGQLYENGAEFQHPTDNCTLCRCRGGSVSCWNQPCEISCTHPARVDGCCPDCRACLYEGKLRLQGVTFTSDVDPCQSCTCHAGNISCQTLQCPQVRCIHPIKKPTECCPSCPVCQFLGQTYADNSRFEHPSDMCQTCSCKLGRVKCERKPCVVQCSHPRHDLCCPKCDDCFYLGELRKDGDTFLPDPCSRCTCRSGNVVCEEQTCPELTCLLKEKVPGECCERCHGCEFRGVQYETDAMWILDENPCISCKCHGGLVTCMEVECYVPCANPVSVPGQCCPVCPTCNFDGRRYKDGEVFSPNGDPCDYCTCEDGHLRCVHEACPSVANCPPEQLVDPAPGQCCPSCAGFGTTCTRTEIGRRTRPRPEDPCFFCECKDDFNWICMKELCKPLSCPPTVQIFTRGKCCPKCPPCLSTADGKYYQEGDTWLAADNPCMSCHCQNEAVSCDLRQCPAVQCSDSEKLVETQDGCCETCQAVPDAVCFYQGRELEPGYEWTIDECTHCRCLAGAVKCAVRRCPPNTCGPDEVPSIAPGNCCPVCLKQPGTCIVFGDPHYRTFDGTTLHFQGLCKYIMAADCENNDFVVEVQHDDRGAVGEVSWAQNFTVSVAGVTVDLLQHHVVRVDGEVVQLPFLLDPHVYIELSGNTTLLSTDIGIKLSWNGNSYAELSVPGTYKRKTCGLCGNFNGFPQDDLRTKFGQITNSPAVFGNSWKAKLQYKEDCSDVEDVDPCVKAGYRTRKMAASKCAIIKSKTFARCHRLVSPEAFFSSCVYDMCACADDPNCLCDILASYAHECAKAKVKVQWRTSSLCAIACDEEKGFMFDDCGPVCVRTCENRDALPGNMMQSCYKPCVASCQCAADKVVHNGRCIAVSQCPDIQTDHLDAISDGSL